MWICVYVCLCVRVQTAELSVRSKPQLAAISCHSRNGVCSSRSFFCQFDSTIPAEFGASYIFVLDFPRQVRLASFFFERLFFRLVFFRASLSRAMRCVCSPFFLFFFSSARDSLFRREFWCQCQTITACAVRHWRGSSQWFRVFAFCPPVVRIRSEKFLTIFLMRLVAFVIFVRSSSASALLYTLRCPVRQSGRLRFASGIRSQSRRPRRSRFQRPSNLQLTYTSLIIVKFAQVTHFESSATAESIVLTLINGPESGSLRQN